MESINAFVKQTGENEAFPKRYRTEARRQSDSLVQSRYRIAFAILCDWIQTIPNITNKNASLRIRHACLFDKGLKTE